MRLSLISKISTKFSLALLILIIFFGAPAYCDEPSKKNDELLSKILHMEALLTRPCSKVVELMNGLIANGRDYQTIEEERASLYSEWTRAYVNYVSGFIVAQDESGTAIPGEFIRRFLELKKMAEEGGVLAEGPRPDMALIDLAHNNSASKYFYFVEPGSSEANKMRELRYKLEEEYEKLVNDWNKARDDFYIQFEDKGEMKNYADGFEEKTKRGRECKLKYGELSSELREIAWSGNYEHCLGEIKDAPHSVIIDGPAQGIGDIFGPLYTKGATKTPDSLPGMGYKLAAQKMYKPITKPEIGDFPLALHLKFNGTDYFQLERDLLEIKIKAEEDETRILGSVLGKICTIGLVAAGYPQVLFLDSDKLGEFAFKTLYKVTESLAAPVQLVKYVATHPVDSVTGAANFLIGLPKAIGDIKPFELEKKAGDFLWGNTAKLFVAAGEIAQDLNPITWNRFDPKPGETLEQEIDRLKAKLDSTTKVKEGMEVASTITAIVVESLIDKGITKGLGKLDDVAAALKQEKKLQGLLSKVDNLADAKNIANKVDDLAGAKKIANKIDDVVPDNKKVLENLLKEQSENSKKFGEILTGEKQLTKGATLPDDVGKKIGAVDAKGQSIQLRTGDQLGKGGVNTVFVNADDSNLVIRKTNQPMTREALETIDAHDKFARNVLEKEVGGSSIRVAKMEGEFYEQTAEGIVRYQKVEKVSDTALDQVAKQGGSMTKGQQLALEQAHRDLNNSGYVWMDNTASNYSFEKLPGGDDRWRVVVIDPDGIYPIKGGDANAAKAFQEAVNNTPRAIAETGADNPFSKLLAFDTEYEKAANAYKVSTNPADVIDWARLQNANPNMVVVDDIASLHWAPDGKRLKASSDIAKLSDNMLVEAFDTHRYDQLLNDPGYKELVAKQKELNKKIEEIAEKLDPHIKQAEKALEAGPKLPIVPDKPSGIDKDLADKLTLLSQQAANAINAENCALFRKQALAGSREEWLLKALNDCVAQGH
ncbi:MAG TPA: hypothetical protein PKH70_07885 [Syntrophorhabdaceae bacterium]|nr:hypothetical protein [Syntrophorhabdaceae bacterium]